MAMQRNVRRGILVAFAAASLAASAAGDATRGARFFHPCGHCHSVAPGEQGVGPSLAKVYGAKAGTVEGFTRYSESLKGAGQVWDEENLDRWLSDPVKFIPGNTMAFPGVRNAAARADLIAYLKAVSDGTAPARPERVAAARLDLRKAPPEGQVRSITLCKDMYTVETADGNREQVAESNLRFRTDSSELGPAAGKPVAIGAGRNEEGGFVIFASPAEISAFIRRRCP
jgi:cytochrome c